MVFKKIILLIIFAFSTAFLVAQKDTTKVKEGKKEWITIKEQNPLFPSRATFYSAIFPGAGQIYNKDYWKVPIAWAAVGIPTYFYIKNDTDYNRYRTAFKLRKAGFIDEFIDANGNELLSLATLERAQTQLRQNRDLSMLLGIILYALQVVEASVSAHLMQFDTSDNLTLKPIIIQDPQFFDTPTVGLTLKYTF